MTDAKVKKLIGIASIEERYCRKYIAVGKVMFHSFAQIMY